MHTRPSSFPPFRLAFHPARSLLAALLLGAPAWTQTTSRLSLGPGGAEGNDFSVYPVCSADGRYVAFYGSASNLVPGDTNGSQDVFVRDRQSGTTERVSVDSGGVQGNGTSDTCCISADGRYVAFGSAATNLAPGDTNGTYDVFVRDRQNGTTDRVSVDSAGVEGNGHSGYFNGTMSISDDGRYVAFHSYATNLVPGDTNGALDVFVHDRQSGVTERVSVDSAGVQGDGNTGSPSISADGRYVFFGGLASNLVPGDTNGVADVFVRDRQLGTTERVSVDSSEVQGNGNCGGPSTTPDGRYVAFAGVATNLVSGDTNGSNDIFVRDRQLGTTERVSVDSLEMQGNDSSYLPSMSADGRFVAFSSAAINLVPGDTNITLDVFLRDRQLGTTQRVSVSSGGAQGDDSSGSYAVSISADGSLVFFQSAATNLVPGDTNGPAFHGTDVFVHDRVGGGVTSLCDPGVNGVIACPCQNPPAGSGRGCNNSSGTGGARLSAAGASLLSSDSLVFTTSGQKPTAASMLVQGSAVIAGGAIYGQGVRCVGGTTSRLFTTGASGGSITVPNFGAGDPPVSVRSAALGDTIQAGQSRWYLVYYRDSTVLGGCPLTSNFNVTQTMLVTWGP